MKLLSNIICIFLLSGVVHAQSLPCISQPQASRLVANLFLDEYFGRATYSIFDDTFSFYFYSGSFNENVLGVQDAFLTEHYQFTGLGHRFVSKHRFYRDDYTEFAEFAIEVSCVNRNKITATSHISGPQGY